MKNHGKDICEQLKAIRRDIAQENDIPLDIPECNYKGECDGTCPRCEAELQYLEQELSCRSAMGKAAMIAGMAVGLTAGSLTAAAQSVMPEPKDNHHILSEHQSASDTCIFKGCVKDSADLGPLICANVVLKKKDGEPVAGAITDGEGNFTINVPKGKYILVVSYVGYHAQNFPISLLDDNVTIGAIALSKRGAPVLMGMPAVSRIGRGSTPVINVGAPENGETIDSDRIEHMPTP